jgi:hypothetical protein
MTDDDHCKRPTIFEVSTLLEAACRAHRESGRGLPYMPYIDAEDRSDDEGTDASSDGRMSESD